MRLCEVERRVEIGSFIEMEFQKGEEYYNGHNVARLNSGRAGIYHASRILGCNTVYLPYYQCDTVRDFLIRKQVQVRYYSIDKQFNPLLERIPRNSAMVIVNYYGIMGEQRIKHLSDRFDNVIIDNSQAFFAKPLVSCLNVYSARKFIGVPDGAYVIGNNVSKYIEDYEQDFSSDTSLFLLQRIEYGCEGKSYETRMLNEHRINTSDIKNMSKLTQSILNGTDYDFILKKRRENFEIACRIFDEINRFNAKIHYADDCVPMVYPLVLENDAMLIKLLKNKIFQGHWWNYLLKVVESNSFEYWLSRYLIPITIDQRYGQQELLHVYDIVNKAL